MDPKPKPKQGQTQEENEQEFAEQLTLKGFEMDSPEEEFPGIEKEDVLAYIAYATNVMKFKNTSYALAS